MRHFPALAQKAEEEKEEKKKQRGRRIRAKTPTPTAYPVWFRKPAKFDSLL